MPSAAKRAAVEHVKLISGLPHRRRMSALAHLTETEFWEFQVEQLRLQYDNAKKRVPYYRDDDSYPRSLSNAHRALDVIATLPVLPKSDVKNSPESFTRHPRGLFTATHTTGGTTGTPLRVRAGLYERGATNAILEQRDLELTGRRNPRTIRLSGLIDHPDQLWMDIPGTQVAYLSIYQLSKGRRSEIRDRIRAFQPAAFRGYASAHHQLARLIGGEDLGLEQPAAISTSETLEPAARDDIADGLRARVFNEYGSQEGQHLVLECAHGSMHIHPARGIVEILEIDSDQPAAAGTLGRVVVSGLLAREMPLLRYDIGDTALSTGYATGCACGSHWPTIGQVYGRSEDLVRTRDGRRIGMLSYSILKDVDGITLSQIQQEEFDRFTFLIEVDPNYQREEAERAITEKLESRMGYGCHVTFVYGGPIPRTSTGKVRAVTVNLVE